MAFQIPYDGCTVEFPPVNQRVSINQPTRFRINQYGAQSQTITSPFTRWIFVDHYNVITWRSFTHYWPFVPEATCNSIWLSKSNYILASVVGSLLLVMSGIVLGMGSASDRRRYYVTPFLIGRGQVWSLDVLCSKRSWNVAGTLYSHWFVVTMALYGNNSSRQKQKWVSSASIRAAC